jgi:hypothetical protein
MAFEKGQSGNPNGRPLGSRNKSALLADALGAEGMSAAGMLMQAWQAALEAGDTRALAAMVGKVLDLSYAKPPEQQTDNEQQMPEFIQIIQAKRLEKPS